MSIREHFSVTAAGGFVLAGVAAVILATVVATSGYGHKPSPAPAKSAGGTATGAGGEYLLDISDVTGDSKLLP